MRVAGIPLGVLNQTNENEKVLDARFDDTNGIYDATGRHTFTKNYANSNPTITGGIANFVGDNNYQVGSNLSDFTFGLSNFEIVFEIRLSGNAAEYYTIFDIYRNDAYNDSQRIGMYLEQGTRKVSVYGYGGVGLMSSTASISTTQFTQITLKRNAGVLSLWFDNVLDSSIASNVDMSSLFDVVVGGSPLTLAAEVNAKLVGELRRFTVSKF